MPNRRLTQLEIAIVDKIQATTVADLETLAGNDAELLFAARRRLFTRLMHMERGTPAYRTKLKRDQWVAQGGKCAICHEDMPQRGSELDRFEAWKGYTAENTRLVHHDCHVDDQRRKGFTDAEVEIVERIEELDEVTLARDVAEIFVADEWTRIDIQSALIAEMPTLLRCPACHGQVRAHKAGTTGQRAHFEHMKSHAGCRLRRRFSGVETPHPDALF